jgi:uncharacterized protein (UPF0276 family)
MALTAGLGFKTQHLDVVLTSRDPGLWFEVHAENYMVDGGPRLAALTAVRDRHPIAIHAVGLSLASVEAPDADYLDRLARLADRFEPVAVSDHLAWQKHDGVHHADFLPFPRTSAALALTADNVDRVQARLRRPIMVENPSLYVDLPGHEMSEAEFLAALCQRTGCGLLVDVNNLYVSAVNLGFRPEVAVDAIPALAVGEVHLAGHAEDDGGQLLIDTHDAPVAEAVWALWRRLIDRIGPRPTLIERDDHIPEFATLMAERRRADLALRLRLAQMPTSEPPHV